MILGIKEMSLPEENAIKAFAEEEPRLYNFLASDDEGRQITAAYRLNKGKHQEVIDIIAKRCTNEKVRNVVLPKASKKALEDIIILMDNDRFARIEAMKYVNDDRFLYKLNLKELFPDVKIAIVSNLKNIQMLQNIRKSEDNQDIIESVDQRLKFLQKKQKQRDLLNKIKNNKKKNVHPLGYVPPTNVERRGGHWLKDNK